MRRNLTNIAIWGNVFILLLAFLFLGEYSVFYVGAFLFFVQGFAFPAIKEKSSSNILFGFIKPVVVFFIIIWAYFVLKYRELAELVNLTGFLWYFIDFAIFYFFGYFLAKIKRNTVKILVFYSLAGILFYRACVFFSHPVAVSLTGVFYFYAGSRLFLKYKLKWYYVVAGLLIPFFLFYVILGNFLELTLLKSLLILMSILFSLLFVKSNRNGIKFSKRQVIILSAYVIIVMVSYTGALNLCEYLFNRDMRLPENKVFIESFSNMEGEEIVSESFKGEVVVLDLWSTGCSTCFKKFPEFERFYNKNKEKVLIYAVGIPYKNQGKQKVENVIRKLDYKFPFLISNNDFIHFRKKYLITGVPSIIILDKNGKIVYNGSLNNNPVVWVNNLQILVNDLLKYE